MKTGGAVACFALFITQMRGRLLILKTPGLAVSGSMAPDAFRVIGFTSHLKDFPCLQKVLFHKILILLHMTGLALLRPHIRGILASLRIHM